jgi:hypothetical protein
MNDQPNNQNNNQPNNNNQNNNQNRGGQPQNNNNQPKQVNPSQKPATEPQNPEQRRRVLRIAGIVIILVVLLAIASNGKWGHKTPSQAPVSTLPEGCAPGALFNTIDGKPCPVESTLSETKDDTTAAPGGYEEAIRLYAGKVVVFDASCKPLPASPTFAPGTRILVANNSASTLTLAINDKSESLDAYHYFTTPLGAVAGKAVISCNGKPAATVVIK